MNEHDETASWIVAPPVADTRANWYGMENADESLTCQISAGIIFDEEEKGDENEEES